MESEPREYTTEEVERQFLEHIWHLLRYWERQDCSTHDKMTGLVHSILSTIDGCSAALPAFLLAPAPHESDKEFHIEEGENWYSNTGNSIEVEISGSLHEKFYQFDPQRLP